MGENDTKSALQKSKRKQRRQSGSTGTVLGLVRQMPDRHMLDRATPGKFRGDSSHASIACECFFMQIPHHGHVYPCIETSSTLDTAEDGCHEDLGPASLAQLSSLRGRDDVSKDWVLTVDPLVPDPVLLSSARYGLKLDCSAAPTGTSTYADAKPASWK